MALLGGKCYVTNLNHFLFHMWWENGSVGGERHQMNWYWFKRDKRWPKPKSEKHDYEYWMEILGALGPNGPVGPKNFHACLSIAWREDQDWSAFYSPGGKGSSFCISRLYTYVVFYVCTWTLNKKKIGFCSTRSIRSFSHLNSASFPLSEN